MGGLGDGVSGLVGRLVSYRLGVLGGSYPYILGIIVIVEAKGYCFKIWSNDNSSDTNIKWK